ncbi:MAG: 2Fe-2S iron-sulfur cluster-binding protein, partial [Pseudomonadales bacterium]|nr:2Fe-2S iron-sulfur cluster-binding protein [Pseudomonadales bacterium]
MIEFLLHNDRVQLQDINPNTTVLQYLREHRQLTGTKEGCASGDCGACTVVIAQLDEQNQLCYQSINACITLISALDGKQLISVEDLQQQQQLHSVQQAMVDCDGSQCGFCTPGFVMSLFALQKNCSSYDKHKVQQALAGNLCRCTGYRAIDRAAAQALNDNVVDHFDPLASSTSKELREIKSSAADGNHAALNYQQQLSHIPKDVASLAQLLIDYPQATLIAGGTDLAVEITQRAAQFSHLIS